MHQRRGWLAARECGPGRCAREAGGEPEELDALIRTSERTRLQAGIAISAATRTGWPAKVRALGRALASGLLAEDDAQIDSEMLILAAMADIEAPHLSLLELLADRVPPRWVGDEPIAHPRRTKERTVGSYGVMAGQKNKLASTALA